MPDVTDGPDQHPMTEERDYLIDVWEPIVTAPRDGRWIKMRQGKWAPFKARWQDGCWQPLEYQHGVPATHWLREAST